MVQLYAIPPHTGYEMIIINQTSEIAHIGNVHPTEGQLNPPFPNVVPGLGGKVSATVFP